VAQQTIEAILVAHSRSNFPEALINEVIHDVANKPNSHIGGYLKVGLAKGFQANPLCKMYDNLMLSGQQAATQA
jgi:hypothetical protein